MTRATSATASLTRATAVRSPSDSRFDEVVATKTASEVDSEWNGAARRAACSLGMLAGMNWELLFFATLEIPGRPTASAAVPTIHVTTTSHRKRTVSRPSEVKENVR